MLPVHPPALHSRRVATHMPGAPPTRPAVRFRTERILALAALGMWAVPPIARADVARTAGAPPRRPETERPDSWPLAFTRAVHAARLRVRGATIVMGPGQRLQQAPNDCALAVIDELQRASARPIPDRAWLAHALTLGAAGVPLDSLAPTLRRLGWVARTTRGIPSLYSHPLHPPAIALVHPGHYVLLTARTAARVEYFDPLVGQVRQPLSEFEARWTGKAVQLSAPDD